MSEPHTTETPRLDWLWTDPRLRVVVVLCLLHSISTSSVMPYQSLIGIQRLGLSAAGYGAVFAVGGLVYVLCSVAGGMLADRLGSGRRIALVTTLAALAGFAAVFFLRSIGAFVLAHAVLLPMGGVVFVLLFGLARQIVEARAPGQSAGVMSAVRATFSLPFALAPPLWGVALQWDIDLFAVYGTGTLAMAAILLLVYRSWPVTDATSPAASGTGTRQALAAMMAPRVLVRTCLMATLNGMSILYLMILSLLVITDLGGTEAHAGLFVGLVALLEIPTMLLMIPASRHCSTTQLIIGGSLIYATFFFGLGTATEVRQIWWTLPSAGVGAGIILSMSLGYLQGLLPDRPGSGASLIAVANFSGGLVAALAIGFATPLLGYSGTALMAGCAVLAAAVLLTLLDRPFRAHASSHPR